VAVAVAVTVAARSRFAKAGLRAPRAVSARGDLQLNRLGPMLYRPRSQKMYPDQVQAIVLASPCRLRE